jgi:hypothetical protein
MPSENQLYTYVQDNKLNAMDFDDEGNPAPWSDYGTISHEWLAAKRILDNKHSVLCGFR